MKILNKLLIILLVIFSFFYTNKVVDIIKKVDPIMKEIKKTEKKYLVEAENAKVIGNNIISGKNGKTINYEESYNKMKKYGTYNESLTTLKEVTPVISINNNYDKYIVRGNIKNRKVSLVFIVDKDKNINKIINILDKNNIKGTFFIDGNYLENNINLISNNKEHEFELLSYNNNYNEQLFKTSLYYLESISKNKPKYCYTKYDNEELLDFCKRLKLHTIKPTLYIKNDLYKEVKNNLSNSIIISLDINSYIEKELPIVINYIRSKGYKLVILNDLIREE